MLNFWKKIFHKPKGEEDENLDQESDNKFEMANEKKIYFILSIDDLIVGYLRLENSIWRFNYSEEFKLQHKYHRLVGFPSLEKTYESEVLWPFFKIRIPGLKQPMIREIIEKEKINSKSELELLKRFGSNSVSNPYILKPETGEKH